MSPTDLGVDHDANARRFQLRRGDRSLGVLAYRPVGRPSGDLVDIYTTQISPSERGRGLGEVLVRAALDHFRQQGTAVKASCWFVADFLDANPEYDDLRDGAGQRTAARAIPDDRPSVGTARAAHDLGMADTNPTVSGGDPGRPRPLG